VNIPSQLKVYAMRDDRELGYSATMGHRGLVAMVAVTSLILVASYIALGACLVVEASHPNHNAVATASRSQAYGQKVGAINTY